MCVTELGSLDGGRTCTRCLDTDIFSVGAGAEHGTELADGAAAGVSGLASARAAPPRTQQAPATAAAARTADSACTDGPPSMLVGIARRRRRSSLPLTTCHRLKGLRVPAHVPAACPARCVEALLLPAPLTPNPTEIRVADSSLGDAGAVRLAARLASFPQLQVLKLPGNRIGGPAAPCFQLPRAPSRSISC